MSDETNSMKIPEAAARRIIARAISLDNDERTLIPESDLRSISAELGISSTSIERALAEYSIERTTSLEQGSRRSWPLPLLTSGIGVTLGSIGSVSFVWQLSNSMRGVPLFPIILGIVPILAGALTVCVDDDDHVAFQRGNLALWSGLAVATPIVFLIAQARFGGTTDYSIASWLLTHFRGWLLSSLIGGGAIALRSRRRRHGPDTTADLSDSGVRPVRSLVRRLATTVRTVVRRFLSVVWQMSSRLFLRAT